MIKWLMFPSIFPIQCWFFPHLFGGSSHPFFPSFQAFNRLIYDKNGGFSHPFSYIFSHPLFHFFPISGESSRRSAWLRKSSDPRLPGSLRRSRLRSPRGATPGAGGGACHQGPAGHLHPTGQPGIMGIVHQSGLFNYYLSDMINNI